LFKGHAGSQELLRRAEGTGSVQLDVQGIDVIRALMDATLVRENQRLSSSMVLLTISIWCFCRFYYFAFYVTQHYVDPNYRFTGLWSLARYWMGARPPRV